jgi:hypothetical protein
VVWEVAGSICFESISRPICAERGGWLCGICETFERANVPRSSQPEPDLIFRRILHELPPAQIELIRQILVESAGLKNYAPAMRRHQQFSLPSSPAAAFKELPL